MASRQTTTDLDQYFRDIGRHRVLNREEEVALALRFRAGDKAAGQQLVTANLRLVVKIAKAYQSQGVGLADLIQEGNLGLMTAVSKFDPDRGVRLISYAAFWIKANLRAYLLRTWSLVKIGTTQEDRQLFFALRKRDRQATSSEALSEELGVELSRVEQMTGRLKLRDQSLDATTAEGSETPLLDRVVDANATRQDDLLSDLQEERNQRRDVRAALNRLDRRERFILQAHLMADQPKPLRVLAGKLSISRERVRQLEVRACSKMAKALAPREPEPAFA
jgi:RNA polymerase sigma-32 factor